MEILTEFDELQEALKKVNMDESVMPFINGVLVDSPSYNKVQKILDCPEMISAHKYLYDLDLDQLSEDEIEKIDKLYKLGCDRGFIIDDLTDWDAEEKPAAVEPEAPVAEKPVAGTLFKAKVPCWTIIYSATSKDGEIKTGEAYSNAISAAAAKADVKAKLSTIGYSNITILAIESCEADVEIDSFSTSETEDVEENDMLNGRPHNAHTVSEADEKKDGEEEKKEDESTEEEEPAEEEEESAEEETEETEETSKDGEEEEESTEEESSEEEEESTEEPKDNAEGEEETEEEKKDDDAEEDKDELDANQKAELKDKYKKTFKNTLIKCKFDTSFNDLTLEQKVKFFTELAKAWTKNEPSEFMTDKEVEQLNNIVAKPEND